MSADHLPVGDALARMTDAELRAHLVETRLAGSVATPVWSTAGNCEKLVAGHPDYTFGMSDWRTVTLSEVRSAVVSACGEQSFDGDPAGPSWIDPEATLAALAGHREVVAAHAARRSSVLLATGHPTGLLGHYAAVARVLGAAGCRLLQPFDDQSLPGDDGRLSVRYVAGVACVRAGGDLVHTHRPSAMEAMLDVLRRDGRVPDLVVGDHGQAGAAVEQGIDTLAIADVNDPALFVAEARGRTHWVLPIDDNLAPTLYGPVTAAIVRPLDLSRRDHVAGG